MTALLAAAIGTAYNVSWIQHAPTSWLLGLQKREYNDVARELMRRAQNWPLSAADERRMLTQGTAAEPQLFFRNPHPHDAEIAIEARCHSFLSLSASVTFDANGFVVDGEPIASHRLGKRIGDYSTPVSSARRSIPRLPPGRHRIEARGTVTPEGSGISGFVSIPFTAAGDITVVEASWESFVTPRLDTKMIDEIRAALDAAVTGMFEQGNGAQVEVHSDRPSVLIDARVEYRLTPDGAWLDAEDLGMTTVRDERWVSRTFLLMWKAASAPEHPTVRLRLVPDPRAAFDAGLTEYFGGVIVWDPLKIRRTTPFKLQPEFRPTFAGAAADAPQGE